jgi:DNA repair protein RadC
MEECNSKLRLKDWAEEDRPREKLMLKGISSLSDTELLAIIIGSGSKKETVVELSQRILQSANNDIKLLGKMSIKHLMTNFKGIGEAKAISIVAALELGKRRQAAEFTGKKQISCSCDIYHLFHPLLCDLYYEEFWALFMNRSFGIIDKLKIGQGGVSEVLVDTKLIYKGALERLATYIALCHNHPSGNILPSRQDDEITMRIKKGIELLGMTLTDHVVLCDGNYYSYADEGRI